MPSFLNPDQIFFDNEGAVAALGTVYFGRPYEDPVDNPKNPYSDASASTTQISAVQQLTSAGKFVQRVYLSGFYSVRLVTAAGVQVFNDPAVYSDGLAVLGVPVVQLDQVFPEILAQNIRIDGISTLWNAKNLGTALHMLASFTDRIAMFKGSGVNVDGSDLDCDDLTEPQYYKIRNIQNMPSGYTEGELVVFAGKDEYLQLFYRWDGTVEYTVQFRIYSGGVAQWTPWLSVPVVVDYGTHYTSNVDSLRTEGSWSIEPSAFNLPGSETRGGLVVKIFNGVMGQTFYGYSGNVYDRVLNGGTGLWCPWRLSAPNRGATAFTGDLEDLKYDIEIQCESPTNRPAGETNGCLESKTWLNFVTHRWWGVSTNKTWARIYNGTSNTWGAWVQESN